MVDQPTAAVHLGDGNYYDNIRLDINASHARMDAANVNKRSIKRSGLVNRVAYLFDGFLQKYRLLEFLTTSGLRRQWFNDFYSYWTTVLNGRPLSMMDIGPLLHEYRKRQQYTSEMSWDSPTKHVQNWQDPSLLYHTLWAARKVGLFPIVGYKLWPLLKPNMALVEYGCGVAPYYYSYRRYFTHLNCHWLLVDIPNFAFHDAKHLYCHDPDLEFMTIQPSDFTNPLKDKPELDVVILTTVLEHLDDPTFVVNYLLGHLKVGGILVFDFVMSQGFGLDTPNALAARRECLRLILEQVDLIHGKVNMDESVGLCIARKKG